MATSTSQHLVRLVFQGLTWLQCHLRLGDQMIVLMHMPMPPSRIVRDYE